MSMDIALYENAMQVVPLILIALFLEGRGASQEGLSRNAARWKRWQDKIIVVFGATAFMVSTLAVAGVFEPGRITRGVVIAAVAASVGLLFAQIWLRFERPRARRSSEPPVDPSAPAASD